MENLRGKSLEYWKENAEEDYLKTPISVLKYIVILEELLQNNNVTTLEPNVDNKKKL